MNTQNLIMIAISLMIGGLIACHTFCGCTSLYKSNDNKEGFVGASLDYSMSNGVPGDTWTQSILSNSQIDKNMYASLDNNVGGSVPPKNMFMWNDNKFLPECCYTPQVYSSSTGCACISKEQMQFISERGGNNTLP